MLGDRILLLLALLALSLAMSPSASLEALLSPVPAVPLSWLSSSSVSSSSPRSVALVADPTLAELSSAARRRGHTVTFVHEAGAPFLGDALSLSVPADTGAGSRFGPEFVRALAFYKVLKTRSFDAIVFSSRDGTAYLCQEAKRAGIAFLSTALVVRLEAGVPRSEAYSDLVAEYISRQSVVLADAVFSTSLSEEAVRAMHFQQRVSVWTFDASAVAHERVVALLETQMTTTVAQTTALRTPLVSCIVTSFNRPEMLRQAVASLKKQTHRNLEIIVVDDASTDAGVATVLAELEKEGVRVVRQASNKYLGAARNAGARTAKGEYVMFLDDDNIALPSMVQTLVSSALHAKVQVVVNAHYTWRTNTADATPPPADVSHLRVWCPVGPAVVAGMKGNVFGNANFLVEKKTFFALSGFTEERAGWEDYEFHARAAIAGVEYVVVPEPLMLYRMHSGSQMSRDSLVGDNAARVMRVYKNVLREAGVSETETNVHLMGERAPIQCSITELIFLGSLNVDGGDQPSCRTLSVGMIVSDSGVDYLGLPTMIQSFVINGITMPITSYTETRSPPTLLGPGRQTWNVTIDPNNLPSNYPTANGQLTVSITLQPTTVCTGTTVSVNCVNPSSVCFHDSTTIRYKGNDRSLSQLRAMPSECAVPHVVTSDGVKIFTSCNAAKPLRLTPDHLVYTATGLVAAGKGGIL